MLPAALATTVSSAKHRHLIPLLGAIFAGIIALWGIAAPEYWNDEAATVSAVTRNYPELLKLLTRVDAVHALYYILIHPWAMLFGTSELALRFPSAIALAFTNFFLVKIAQELAPYFRLDAQKERLLICLTALFGAILPGLSWAGQEARGYAFGALCATVVFWFFLGYLQTPTPGKLLGFVVFQILAAGFTLYSIFLLPLYCFGAFWKSTRQGRQIILASALVGICILPLIYIAHTQSGQLSWLQRDIPEMYRRMYSQYFFSPANASGVWGSKGQKIAPWLATVSIILGVWALFRVENKKLYIWLTSFIFSPMLILFFLRTLGMQLYTERYLIFGAPFVILTLSIAIVQFKPLVSITIGLIFGLLFIPALIGQNENNAKINHLYRTAAHEINSANSVIYLNAANRNASIAYPPP